MNIDFGKLTLRGALDFAILIEEDAELRYRDFARAVSDPQAAAFFREMVANESKHRRQLEARRTLLFRHLEPRIEISVLDEPVEGPGEGEVPEAIGVREAMEVALRAERRAWEFYDRAIHELADPDVRAFFEELREEEVEHQEMLRAKIAEWEAGSPRA